MSLIPYASYPPMAQYIANQVGSHMRDVDPMDVLRAARTAQRFVRGHMGRKKAAKARMSNTGTKRRKQAGRFQPSRTNLTGIYSFGTDTGPGAAVQLGLLLNEQLPAPDFNPLSVTGTDSMMMDVRGYKICRQFYINKIATAAVPTGCGAVEVHWALIQFKCPISSASVDNLLPQKFFRSGERTDQKAVDFGVSGSPSNAYPTAGDPWEMRLNCLPMNPNNGYNIITHRKKVMIPTVGGFFGGMMPQGELLSEWKIEYYQPVNRKMELENESSARWKNPIYEVFWTNATVHNYHPNDTSASGVSDYVRTNKAHTCFYNAVK